MTEEVLSEELAEVYFRQKRRKLGVYLATERGAGPTGTPADVFELYRTNSTVRAVVSQWMSGYISWEEALITCVKELSREADDIRSKLLKVLEHSPPPAIYVERRGTDE